MSKSLKNKSAYSVKKTAEILDVNYRTVLRYINDKDLAAKKHFVKPKKWVWLVDAKSIKEFMRRYP